jgi:hypothetical protein
MISYFKSDDNNSREKESVPGKDVLRQKMQAEVGWANLRETRPAGIPNFR